MPPLSFSIYDLTPRSMFPHSIGGRRIYAGPADADGEVTLLQTAADPDPDAPDLDADETGAATTAIVSIGGRTASRAPIAAGDSWTLLDTVTGGCFELIAFRVESGPYAGQYTLSETALVPGRTYETVDFAPCQPATPDGPEKPEDDFTLIDGTSVGFPEVENIVCFVAGTRIDTPEGPRAIERLAPGDLVLTTDRGPMPIRWHGWRSVTGREAAAPIRFAEGAVGNTRPLLVSPQHRMLIRDHRAQIHFGENELLVPAKALVNGHSVTEAPTDSVTYHHLMLDWHQIITAEGAPTETYHPGAYSLCGLEPECREALFEAFPGLRSDPRAYGRLARNAVRWEDARVLAA